MWGSLSPGTIMHTTQHTEAGISQHPLKQVVFLTFELVSNCLFSFNLSRPNSRHQRALLQAAQSSVFIACEDRPDMAETIPPSQTIDNPDVPAGRKRFIPLGMSLPNHSLLVYVYREVIAKFSQQRTIQRS